MKLLIIFCLPPNTTHAAQPLDVRFFKPLKAYWSSVCHKFLATNPGVTVTKLHFSKLFSEAWLKASNPTNIVAGFRKTGICPLDSAAIKVPELPDGTEELPDGTEPELPHGTEPELPPEPELPHGTEPEPENLSESVIGSASDGEDDCLSYAPPESSMRFTPSTRAIVDLFESSSGGEDRSTVSMNGSMELFSSPAQSLSISPTGTPRSSTPNVRPTVPYSPSQSLTETRKVISTVTSFLTLPTQPTKAKATKPPGKARVLTSEEALTMMQEKEQRKKEEKAKEARKKERETKRVLREEEKKRKAEEREKKTLERQEKAQAKAAEIEEKRRQRELKRQEKSTIPGKAFVTRSTGKGQSMSNANTQSKAHTSNSHTSNSSDNTCCVCSGTYDDDIQSQGILRREWVQCPAKECKVWAHEECVEKDEERSMICICGNVFQ